MKLLQRRFILIIAITLIFLFLLSHVITRGDEAKSRKTRDKNFPFQPLSFRCSNDSDGFCEFSHLCLSRPFGLFVIGEPSQLNSLPLPEIMPIALEYPPMEFRISPSLVPLELIDFDRLIVHPDSHLMVVGTHYPYHLSHMIISTVVPIFHLLQTYGQKYSRKDLLTVGRYLKEDQTRYGFPFDYLGLQRQFLSAAYHSEGWFWDSQLNPLPILEYNSEHFDLKTQAFQNTDEIHCYPYGTIGVDRFCSHCRNKPEKELFSELRSRILSHYGIIPQRQPLNHILVIQRQKARKINNIEAVLEALSTRGFRFHVTFLESLSFQEQIRIFAEYFIVIAPHGNGNIHVHWMEPGSIFVELFAPSGFGEGFYESIANQVGLLSFPVFCSLPTCKEMKNLKSERDEDVWVDITVLDTVLDRIQSEITKRMEEREKE